MSNGNRRFKRLAATGALALGSLTLLSASPASAARDTGDACPPGVAEDGFTDTGDDGSPIESAVDCLVAYEVTSGTSATTYGGSGEVSRGQMASFIANKLALVNGLDLPTDAPDAFTDDDGTTHEDNINILAALEVVRGVGDGLFDPSRSVTRAEMATFIVNQMTAAGADLPDVPDTTEFPDIEGNTHEDNIRIIEALDITDGNADGTYGPDQPVSRGQMAFFLTRDIDVLVEQGLIDPIRGDSNQTISVTPADAAIIGFGDIRQYSVDANDAATVNIALFDCDNVSINDGIVTFADNEVSGDNVGNGEADDPGDVDAAFIAVVNGASAGDVTAIEDVATDDGEVTFTIEGSDGNFGCVVPVVFAHDDEDIPLDDDNEPTVPFGVGGSVTVVPPEAGAADVGPVDVIEVDKDANFFVGDNGGTLLTYYYDDNDQFRGLGQPADITGVFTGTADDPRTPSQFETELSEFDEVTVDAYQPDAGNISSFQLSENRAAPSTVVTTADLDSEGNTDVEVAVTPTAPVTIADMDGDDVFVVARIELDEDAEDVDPVTPGKQTDDLCTAGDLAAMQDAGSIGPDDAEPRALVTKSAAQAAGQVNGNTFTFEDDNVAQGCWLYVGVLIIDGDLSPAGADVAGLIGGDDPIVVGGSGDTEAPTIDDATLANGGTLALIDSGDVITLEFSEEIADDVTTAVTGGILIFSDGEGELYQVDCSGGGNATCALNADGDVLTITLTADPELFGGAAGDGAAQTPGTITDLSAEFADLAGNEVDLAGSADVVINIEV